MNPPPKEEENAAAPSWKWLRPPPRTIQTLEEEAQGQVNPSISRPKLLTHVDIIPKVHLTKEEVIHSLTLHNANRVVWKPCGTLADAMVFATARSNAHALMLAQVMVKATKDRDLTTYNKYHPIEGTEEWFLVDTGKLMIHIFSGEKKRREVDLEGHLEDLQRHTLELRELYAGKNASDEFLLSELQKIMDQKLDDLSIPDGEEHVNDAEGGIVEVLKAVDRRSKRKPNKNKKTQESPPKPLEYYTQFTPEEREAAASMDREGVTEIIRPLGGGGGRKRR